MLWKALNKFYLTFRIGKTGLRCKYSELYDYDCQLNLYLKIAYICNISHLNLIFEDFIFEDSMYSVTNSYIYIGRCSDLFYIKKTNCCWQICLFGFLNSFDDNHEVIQVMDRSCLDYIIALLVDFLYLI